jgi:pyruvate dehydrogenase E1 component alpha subunit
MNYLTKDKLIQFEKKVFDIYEKKKIRAPIHLSGNNETNLIKIFKNINRDDWVISNWRNHYHALLHGIPEKVLLKKIVDGQSMHVISKKYNFYSSSIVAGGISIGLGIALGIKKQKKKNKVWVFIGDMTAETGLFHEAYKYSKNFKLPINFVIEDNGFSTNTPTELAWNRKSKKPNGVYYYKYKRKYPHHGTGKWLLF